MSKQKTTKTDRKYVTMLGVKIDSTDYDGVLRFVANKLENKKKFYIVTPNPEILLKASSDIEFHRILNNADLSIPDGVGLLWAQRLTGGISMTRLPGRIVMTRLLQMADDRKLTVFFLGSTSNVIKKTLKKVERDYSHIKAYGDSGPSLLKNGNPDTEVDSAKQIELIKKINTIHPDLLFVAFGAPKQEKWIAQHLNKLHIGGAMVVGGSLDTFSESLKPVPQWISTIGFEWLWRLIQEPQRIGRIINAVVIFPITVLVDRRSL